MTETRTSPAAGWYADPGGSDAQRWWDGQAWTQTVQLPKPPPIEYTVAAPVVPAPAVNQFGSPLVEAARTHRPWHRPAPATR